MSRSLLWKILITVAASGATFTATTLTRQDQTWSLMLSAFVGGVILVVQFLLDVETKLQVYERRQLESTQQLQASVASELERVNQVNSLLVRLESGPLGRQPILELVQHAAELNRSSPALAHRIAASEISNLSNFLKDLARGREVSVDQDDWSWIFTLTESVQETLDATSYKAGGADQEFWDDDLWRSELGQRYLDLQARAIKRGVAVRRVFILETPELAAHPNMSQICDRQVSAGIDIRLIDAGAARAAGTHVPLVIFDRVISFELTSSRFRTAGPGFIKTTLVLNPSLVNARLEMFQRLWALATKYESA